MDVSLKGLQDKVMFSPDPPDLQQQTIGGLRFLPKGSVLSCNPTFERLLTTAKFQALARCYQVLIVALTKRGAPNFKHKAGG